MAVLKEMIVFDLKCKKDHVFEAWFHDSATYESQATGGEIVCPVCGDTHVTKAPMAPAVAGDRQETAEAAPSPAQEIAEVHQAMRKLRDFVEKNSDNVGDKFAAEARKIHNGETEKRSIHGEATANEAKELKEEGVPFAAIPWPSRTDS